MSEENMSCAQRLSTYVFLLKLGKKNNSAFPVEIIDFWKVLNF